jgi:hypothetical protein
MSQLLGFARDILLRGVGFWILPWTFACWVAFELYMQVKRNSGFDDAGLGWPLIVLALMLTFGHHVFGPRFQAIYAKHFPDKR